MSTEKKIKSRLTIKETVYRITSGGRKRKYSVCDCECGKKDFEVREDGIKRGAVVSCGCYVREAAARLGKENKTHGQCETRIYTIYRGMLDRCYNPNSKIFSYYGGRGISVCERWLESFENFFEDMKEGYSATLELDRRSVDEGYSPENCRWVDAATQSFNKRKYTNNKSGRTGVYLQGQKYRVSIRVGGDLLHLGTTSSYEDAVKLREEAELNYYGVIKE